jgi:hypothetical protein
MALTFVGLSVWAFTTPAHALYFASYELSKKILSPTKSMDEKGPLVHFLAGIGADIGGSLFWVPMVRPLDKACPNAHST